MQRRLYAPAVETALHPIIFRPRARARARALALSLPSRNYDF